MHCTTSHTKTREDKISWVFDMSIGVTCLSATRPRYDEAILGTWFRGGLVGFWAACQDSWAHIPNLTSRASRKPQ